MRKAYLFALLIVASTSFLAACGKDSGSNNNGQYVDPYGNYYNYNNTQYGALPYAFGNMADILNIKTYRKFLIGDACTEFFNMQIGCKSVDSAPYLVLALQKLEMTGGNSGIILGQLTININPDYGYYYNGSSSMKKEIPLRFVYGGSTTVLDGQNQDYYTGGSHTPRQIRVRLSGLTKTSSQVQVQVMYDGQYMLDSTLIRQR